MKTQTTNNIKISVETKYEESYSFPANNKYVFSYWIKIENLGDHPVQLLNRQWIIKDSNQSNRTVNGKGVIGKQPIIKVGSFIQYSSWCPISSTLGEMCGKYELVNLDTNQKFFVIIPCFSLIFPPVKN